MASYRGHLTFSTALGGAYAGAAFFEFGTDWATAALAGGVTALGGLLPDLDSDSGVPVRELFNMAATLVPLMLLRPLMHEGLSAEQILVVLAGLYLFIRFGVRAVFKRLSVHRGMFHSLPAMVIAGLIVFLGYQHPSVRTRTLMAVGVMIGFLSHLVLDELCSVDLHGAVPKLNKFAGSALKLTSSSLTANLTCYALLALFGFLTLQELHAMPGNITADAALHAVRPHRPPAPASVPPVTPPGQPEAVAPTLPLVPPQSTTPPGGPVWRPGNWPPENPAPGPPFDPRTRLTPAQP
jgi:hypothetical protein